MNKVPYHNDTDKTVHVGPVSIYPGGTRDVDPAHLVSHEAVEEAASNIPLPGLIDELLGLSVAKLIDRLPDLSAKDLDSLESAEKVRDNSRASALNAIAAERVSRASQSVGGDKEAEEFKLLVVSMSDDELANQDYPEESVYFAIVEAEKQRRERVEFEAGLDDMTEDDLIAAKDLYQDEPEILALIEQRLAKKDEQ